MTRRPKSQVEIIQMLLRGQATPDDLALAQENYERWISEEWDGDEPLSLAYCLNELSEAAGKEWGALHGDDAAVHLWFFHFLCPRRSNLEADAREYRDAVRRQGGFHRFAMVLKRYRGARG